MGLENFVNELKLISGYKRASISSKTDHDGPPSTISDGSCITFGIGSTDFDHAPVETFQKYLCQQVWVVKYVQKFWDFQEYFEKNQKKNFENFEKKKRFQQKSENF